MYTLPSKLKVFAIIFMVIGALGMTYSFMYGPKTTADVKEMMAGHDDHGAEHAEETHEVVTHGEGHDEMTTAAAHRVEGDHDADAAHSEEKHLQHTLDQMKNRPWSALYIACFFFFMIALGVLAFYAIN
jgi:hypothetical protein